MAIAVMAQLSAAGVRVTFSPLVVGAQPPLLAFSESRGASGRAGSPHEHGLDFSGRGAELSPGVLFPPLPSPLLFSFSFFFPALKEPSAANDLRARFHYAS